ncbi:MAG: nucleoside deaminase, partial [Saprospiraceae bacterium]
MYTDEYFLNLAISQAIEGVKKKEGGPFGAVIVRDNDIISIANNRVLVSMDPTAHAEIEAIRGACSKLSRYQLKD